MRHDGAQNSREVTAAEGNTGLHSLAVIALLSWHAGVHHLDDGLEGGELHHGIGNLAAPERVDALVQPSPALLASDGLDTIEGALVRVGHLTLHTNLDSLERTQGNVSEKLGRSRGSEVEPSLVLVCCLLAGHVRVGLLEVLIPPVLEGSLGGVSK